MQASNALSLNSRDAPTKPKQLSDLPAEMRQMIIDRMDAKSKCRFSQVSRSCRKDVKESRNWVNCVVFQKTSKSINITVYHDEETIENEQWEFSYEFCYEKEKRTSFLKCFNHRKEEIGKMKLESSLDPIQYASSKFRDVLEQFQKSVKKLHIVGWESGSLKDYIATLTNLRSLTVSNCRNLDDFLGHFRRPLESFDVVKSDTMQQDLMQFEQIYKVSNHLKLDNSNFDFNQLRRLSAAIIHINIGSLTPQDIYAILEEWKNDTWPVDQKFYKFHIHGSTFDIGHMLQLFGQQHLNVNVGGFEIRHSFNNERKVVCYFETKRVLFFFDY